MMTTLFLIKQSLTKNYEELSYNEEDIIEQITN